MKYILAVFLLLISIHSQADACNSSKIESLELERISILKERSAMVEKNLISSHDQKMAEEFADAYYKWDLEENSRMLSLLKEERESCLREK